MHVATSATGVAVVAGAAVAVGGFTLPLMLDSQPEWLLLPGVVVLMVAARSTFGTVILSPLQIVGGGLALLGSAGYLFYPAVLDAPAGTAIRLAPPGSLYKSTLALFLAASASVLAGGLLWALVRGRLGKGAAATLSSASEPSPRLRRSLLLFATLPLALLVAGVGPGSLVRRSSYLAQHVGSNQLLSAGGQLAIVAVLALGFLWGLRSYRLLALILTGAYFAVMFGVGSRRLALIPLVFAIGLFAARADRRSKIVLGGAVVLSLYLVQLPLQLRALPSHGLQPYLEYLPGVLSERLPVETTALNVLISFAIVGVTAFATAPIPAEELWISVSPLPGGMSGWYLIADKHRLNEFTPFAGLGELANAGWGFAVGGCLLLGVVLAHLDFRSKRLMQLGTQMAGLGIVALSGLFLLFFAQYNLRAAGRMLYYAVALDVMTTLWLWFRRTHPRVGSGVGVAAAVPRVRRTARATGDMRR